MGEPYLASKAEKIVTQQVDEAGTSVEIVDWQIWESRRVWRLLINDVNVYLQVNPNFLNNKIKLNIVNLVDKNASEECLDSMLKKGRFWTVDIYHDEFAKKTGFIFSDVREVKKDLPKILNTIKKLPEIDTPSKGEAYINYNCKYKTI